MGGDASHPSRPGRNPPREWSRFARTLADRPKCRRCLDLRPTAGDERHTPDPPPARHAYSFISPPGLFNKRVPHVVPPACPHIAHSDATRALVLYGVL
jgi:hypothetical protein